MSDRLLEHATEVCTSSKLAKENHEGHEVWNLVMGSVQKKSTVHPCAIEFRPKKFFNTHSRFHSLTLPTGVLSRIACLQPVMASSWKGPDHKAQIVCMRIWIVWGVALLACSTFATTQTSPSPKPHPDIEVRLSLNSSVFKIGEP